MATRAEQARLFNEAIAQGLTEDQALAVAGITNPNDFTYGYGTGKLEPLVIGPPKRTDIEVVSNLADPYPDDEPKYRTVPVSSSSTTTTQTTVTGGTETVTRVTPTTYKDTSQSLALQGQADSVAAQQQARADQLRAEGKTGGQILRDPEYRRLSAEKQNLQDQAQNAKAVDQAGAVTTTVTPGPTSSVTETTVDGKFLTKDTSGYDPTAGAQQANQFVASGGPVENRQPLTATEIADYQNQTATRVNETGAKFQEPFVSDQAAAAEAAYYEANPNEVRAVLAAPPPAEPVVTTTTVEITDAELFAPANTTNTNPGPGYTAPVAAEPTDGELYRKPLGIGGNYSSVYNPETGLYDVVDIDTGRTVDSGLSELNAEVTASQFSQGDPQFETPEMPPELPDVTEPDPPGGNFGSVFDPETQSWSVIDNDTGVIVQTGFNDAASAELQAQLDSQPDPYANQFTDDDINASFTESDLVREPTDQDVIENDARITGENVGIVRTEPAPVGLTESEVIGDFSADPRIAGENVGLDTPAVVTDAARNRAQVQATLANQQRQADSGDWRFKIRLAPGARYLYRGDNGQGVQSGILAPLAVTDGVVFPYTPQVSTNYSARYTEADLPHSNYRGYFYNTSYVDSVQIEGTFTAQDTAEANYLLAVIHFFRSVTKMFYGQASEFRGAPPPLVFLQGFGAYQFSRHPCVISSFRYTLPRDVDYIRADVQPISGLNIQQQRKPGGVPPQSLPTNVFTGALARLAAAGVPKGAVFRPQAPDTLGTRSPTYVPTKMDITLELLPMQTRQQVSQEFNNRDFATGALQKKGFW